MGGVCQKHSNLCPLAKRNWELASGVAADGLRCAPDTLQHNMQQAAAATAVAAQHEMLQKCNQTETFR